MEVCSSLAAAAHRFVFKAAYHSVVVSRFFTNEKVVLWTNHFTFPHYSQVMVHSEASEHKGGPKQNVYPAWITITQKNRLLSV